MAKTNHRAEFELEVGGEPYVWRLQRRPHWTSDPSERRGLAIAVRHAEGQREAVLEFPPAARHRISAPQLKPESVSPDLVAKAIASAIAAGWEPLSRGKPVTFEVDESGG